MTVLGILGGSGVYEIAGLKDATWRRIASPFGETSDEFLFGVLDGLDVVFVPRHGRGHRHSPTSINYRANIDALKRAGVTDILSLSACGSLREDLPPGHFVVVDQFIDRTFAREKSFFGEGFVAHVSMAHPTCNRLADAVHDCAQAGGLSHQVRRHVSRDGRPAVLQPGRIAALPQLGLRRHRHDQHARGQARPRGGDLLRHRRHGHRLRLLASRPRPCAGRRHRARPARQCREGQDAGHHGGAAASRSRGPSPARTAATARSSMR